MRYSQTPPTRPLTFKVEQLATNLIAMGFFLRSVAVSRQRVASFAVAKIEFICSLHFYPADANVICDSVHIHVWVHSDER